MVRRRAQEDMPDRRKTWYARLMTADELFRKTTKMSLLQTGALVMAFSLAGCNQSDARAESKQAVTEQGTAENAVAEEDAAPGPTGQSKYSEEAFSVRLDAPSSLKVGTPATFVVLLEAKSGYKVNEEYPIKFVVAESAAVKPEKSTVRKEDGKLEKKKAELPVTVTISKPGSHEVGGKLSFSVCTDERCLIEKRDLVVTVDAS